MAEAANFTLNCTAIYEPTVFILGQVFYGIWLLISIIFLYIFALKLYFRPRIYLWLFFYTLGFMLWVMCKIMQEHLNGAYKCVITNCLKNFCLVFLSLMVIGIMLDRYCKVRGPIGGGMADTHIGLFIGASGLGAFMIALLDGLYMGQEDALKFNGTESFKCLPAASTTSYKAQLMFKSIFCIICIIFSLVLTCLTAKRILETKLRKKYVIVVNITLLCFVNILVWMMVAGGMLKQASDPNLSLCPTKQYTYIYPYSMPVTVVIVLLLYLFSSRHIKEVMRKSVHIRHSLSSPNNIKSSFRLL
ncbi:A5 [Alcelaphine gammaherpesvirus 2]|uniref:A5 n=1 Tax=Alcelaphine gammaherpesvirus 2 TaxID=138184 RepID=A0A068AAJ6_9GAMA|nr:A5 [Alcelaphine gammaherpesvirus 2]AIA62051.1 A5 [Alcelaphine gammaherpesvirus 2]